MRGTDSKTGESRRNSLPRWPLAKEPLRRLTLGLVKQEIKLARRGIRIRLLIPARLLTGTEPLHKALVFFWRQPADSGFDLLNAVHTGSLAPRSEGATPRTVRGAAEYRNMIEGHRVLDYGRCLLFEAVNAGGS